MNKILSYIFICLFVISAMLPINNACAISDKEYARCKQLSPEFVQAEKDLNAVWKQLNSLIQNKDKKQKLLDNQRNWLKERDANYVNENGTADIPYFTTYTKDRIAELILYKEYVKNNYLPITITGQVIEQTESRYAEDTAYYLYTKLYVNKNEYDIWILLCSSEDKKQHEDVNNILKRAEDNKDKCSILVDYDILGEIKVISFANPSKDEKCGLNW